MTLRNRGNSKKFIKVIREGIPGYVIAQLPLMWCGQIMVDLSKGACMHDRSFLESVRWHVHSLLISALTFA